MDRGRYARPLVRRDGQEQGKAMKEEQLLHDEDQGGGVQQTAEKGSFLFVDEHRLIRMLHYGSGVEEAR